MRRACVIGWPVEHSRSPLIHRYWLKQYGIDGAYEKEAVRPEDLPVSRLARSAWLCRRQYHLAAQGSGVAACGGRRRGGANDRRRQHAVARRCGAAQREQHRRLWVHDQSQRGGARLERGRPAGDGARRRRRGARDPARPSGGGGSAHPPRQPDARPRRGLGQRLRPGGHRGRLAGPQPRACRLRPPRQCDQPRHDRQGASRPRP